MTNTWSEILKDAPSPAPLSNLTGLPPLFRQGEGDRQTSAVRPVTSHQENQRIATDHSQTVPKRSPLLQSLAVRLGVSLKLGLVRLLPLCEPERLTWFNSHDFGLKEMQQAYQ